MTEPLPYHGAAPFDRDLSHLRTLAICHYIYGGVAILFSCIFIIHIVLGTVMLNNPAVMNNSGSGGPPPPVWFGWIFIGMGSCALMLGWTMGILSIISGRYMTAHRRRLFSLI